MRRYTYQKNKKSRREKLGFFTAFSICIVAIGLALWSTFISIGGIGTQTDEIYVATFQRETEAANKTMTGVTTATETTEETTEAPETTAEPTTQEITTETEAAEPYTGDNEGLQTILQVSKSLDYPVSSRAITKEYSEEAVYNATMGDYRAHTGVDFAADIGENVVAMSSGTVDSIYYDEMYGNIIKVIEGNFSIFYCGVSDVMYCVEGSKIERGDIIAKVGNIPCESADQMHLHIEVRVGNKTIDPLTVISNNE